jgi:Flp pilus assembly protein TadB
MSNRAKIAVGGVAVAVILFWILPNWLALLLIIGVPVVGYFALDSSQRRRLRRIGRKEIDR